MKESKNKQNNNKHNGANGKLIFGVFLVFLFIIAVTVMIVGVAELLEGSPETPDKESDLGDTNENGNTDSDGDKVPDEDNDQSDEKVPDNEDDPDENNDPDEPAVLPDPEIIIGVEGEYKEMFEGEKIPDHAVVLEFEDMPTYSGNGIKVKLYFGTSVSSDQSTDDLSIKLLLEKEGAEAFEIASITGDDFYNGRYAISLVDETEGEQTVKMLSYGRVIEVDVSEQYLSGNKGEILFKLTVSSLDPDSGEEQIRESVADNLVYKKKDDSITLSHEKEKTIIYNYEYKTDISDLIDYIEPTGDLWSNDYLLLVNPWNAIEKGEEFTYDVVAPQSKMSAVKSIYNFSYLPSIKLNTTALKALAAMFREAVESTDLTTRNLQITSSYRDYGTQSVIFNNNVNQTKKYVCNNQECLHEYITKHSYKKCEKCGSSVTSVAITREEAVANVKTYSCAPGTSEHQTGLAVDVIDGKYSYDLLEGFKNTEAGKWLAENCARFGFILRFEKEKQDITGIIYEPWHFRYVGRYHATRMTELGMCLEEYVEFLTEEGYFDDPGSVHNPANMEIDSETYLIADKG